MKNTNNENKAEKIRKYELESCLIAAHPEMIRNSNEDEPCDDNRA